MIALPSTFVAPSIVLWTPNLQPRLIVAERLQHTGVLSHAIYIEAIDNGDARLH